MKYNIYLLFNNIFFKNMINIINILFYIIFILLFNFKYKNNIYKKFNNENI